MSHPMTKCAERRPKNGIMRSKHKYSGLTNIHISFVFRFSCSSINKYKSLDAVSDLFCCTLPANTDMDKLQYRLDHSVVPLHYDLKLTPHLSFEGTEKLFEFESEVDIRIKSVKPDVTTFSLHSEELTITSVTLRDAESQENVIFTKNFPDSLNPKLVIRPEIALKENGEYILSIEYNGKIRNDVVGFYASKYERDDGNMVYIGVAQLQPSNARKVFPCFDEPNFKATFTVSINRHNNYKAYSNTKINYSTPIEGTDRTLDIFKQTPKISTMNLAFLITDYQERHIADNFTILLQPKQFQEADFAANYSQRVLDFFDEYTKIPYSSIDGIEKMDLISIPESSAADIGNLGLATFSQFSLLCEPQCRDDSKLYQIKVIAQLFAEMWFGNLVTSEWWSYAWLNEGFATYFAHYALIEKVSNWDIELNFVTKNMDDALNEDFSQHTLTKKNVYTSDDIKNVFTEVTHKKDACVVRMFDHMMGQENFKRAIRKYLNDNKYGTVTPEHLYEALKTEWHNSEVDLHEILTDWTEQSGHPIVTVELSEDGKTIHIKQEQFYLDENKKDNIARQWIIPLSFVTNFDRDVENTQPKLYLLKNGPQEIHLEQPADWVIFNIRKTGYFRVNYDEKTWLKIGENLRQENLGGIDVVTRTQIITDLFTYAKHNLVSYDILFEVIKFLEFETQMIPWDEVNQNFIEYYVKLSWEDFKKFQKYAQPLFSKVYNEVKSEMFAVDSGLKQRVACLSCLFGDRECIMRCKEIVDTSIRENSKIETTFERMAFMVVIMYDSEHYYDKVYDYINSDALPVDSKIPVLACIDDKNKILNYLNSTLHKYTGTELVEQFEEILESICINKEIVFEFAVEHFDKITENASEWDKQHLLRLLGNLVNTADQKKSLQNIAGEDVENFEAIRNADERIKWHEDVGSKISKYLNEHEFI